ncbi:uncharacterized protein LOC143146275 isoform X2 [Ptiloglossa arizonensis]|uniref:uncharacterized protein LOC143146275 isoform X2 n=1 Tax=Ptiloglossa arizonensis TaxID=3350558 RepID=UPI003FA0A15C
MAQVSALTGLSKESVLSTDSQPRSRKRTRSLIGTLPEVKEISDETERKKVGNLATVGVTLGPLTEEEEEGEALKYDKHLTEFERIPNDDSQNASMVWIFIPSVSNLNISFLINFLVLKIRRLLERFLKEDKKYGRFKDNLDKSKEILVTVRRRFLNSINNYFQAKKYLENARDELSKYQKIQFAMENDCKESWVPEVEKGISRDIACREKVVLNLEEEITQAQEEIRELIKEQIEMRSKLKSGFGEYCKTIDFVLLYRDKSMKMLLDPVEKKSSQVTKCKFNQFQRAMMRKFEVRGRTKKV